MYATGEAVQEVMFANEGKRRWPHLGGRCEDGRLIHAHCQWCIRKVADLKTWPQLMCVCRSSASGSLVLVFDICGKHGSFS